MRIRLAGVVWATLQSISAQGWTQSPLDPPGATVLAEARQIVQQMIENPRGPYTRIRWYCNDGSVLAPEPYACREHGGGRQHAEYSADRERLAALGWSVGTIFAALSPDALLETSGRNGRLRELPLEAYMIGIDDGWVLRQARGYRGRVQVEGEEAAGADILTALLADRDWTSANFLLARELARAIPHPGSADDLARDVRRRAIELADQDRAFQTLRAEIHGDPDARTARRVETWAAGRSGDVAAAANELADWLDALYGASGRRARLARHRERLVARTLTRPVADLLDAAATVSASGHLASLAAAAAVARDVIVDAAASPQVRLQLLDLLADLESEIGVSATEVVGEVGLTRGEIVSLASDLVMATYGTGLLSARERDELLDRLQPIEQLQTLAVDRYAALVDALRRAPQWAAGAVRYAFAEPLIRYTALDPRAAQFADELLRGSPLVALGETTRRLAIDLAELTGVSQLINGRAGLSAFGLNPGVAQGTLRLHSAQDLAGEMHFDRNDIVVIPETTPELTPVAGIVTLGEGNPLSHVQLLARNFGIPNIAISADVLSEITALVGRQVVTAVSRNGSLVLAASDQVPSELRAALLPANRRGGSLTVPPVDLTRRAPITLASLRASLSGRVVGPKAANLGELAHLFPGRVAPAIAIPFGVFARHIDYGDGSPRSRLEAAYASHARGVVDESALLEELASVRSAIAATPISPAFRDELRAAMDTEFGASAEYGVFVRSDTNVEDLPEFTGAGLSETLPNIVGVDAIIDSIPRVWASVLSPRAIAWRSSLLTNPDEVYASVLFMKSVPSTKSGVMVTVNVAGGRPGVTVSAAWGVGGGVAGEATETLVLHADGSETLLSESKAPYRRRLLASGGLALEPARDGRVLDDSDKAALRQLAAEVANRYEPVLDRAGRPRPWDIEYGFVDGELTLFQIRPLVERGPELAERIVAALTPPSANVVVSDVRLDAVALR